MSQIFYVKILIFVFTINMTLRIECKAVNNDDDPPLANERKTTGRSRVPSTIDTTMASSPVTGAATTPRTTAAQRITPTTAQQLTDATTPAQLVTKVAQTVG
jgi:hypothetical protein